MANVSSSNGIEKYPKLRLKGFSDPFVIRKIGSFAKCYAGATPSTKNKSFWENGNIPWLSSGEVNKKRINFTDTHITQKGFDNCSTKMVPPGTVVIALAGQGKTRGTVAITNIELCTNQSLASIVTDDTVYDLCLLYYLETQYENLRAISSGDGTRGGLNLQIINDYPVCLPTVDEQIRIAELFMIFDRKIEKQRALVESLKKYKRGVLRKVFDHISTSCKKSLLGNLCVSISSGKTTHVQDHGQYPLIGSTGPIGYTDIEEFNEELILIARVGANAGAVNYFAGSCGVTDNTLVVRVDKAYSVPEYILYFLEYYDPHRLIFGSGQPLVTGGQLKKIEVPIASKDQQEKVVELFTLLNKYCTCAQQQLDLLICAKKALLQQLFI